MKNEECSEIRKKYSTIPNWIKREVVLKKNLSEEETLHFEKFYRSHPYGGLLTAFLDASQEVQKKIGPGLSAFINSRRDSFTNKIYPFNKTYERTEYKAYIKYITNTNISDANKLVFIRQLYFNNSWRVSLHNIPEDKIIFNNPKYDDIVKYRIPLYGIRQAFKTRNIKDLQIFGCLTPGHIYNYSFLTALKKWASIKELEEIFSANPRLSSPQIYVLSDDIISQFDQEVLRSLSFYKTELLKFLKEEFITEEMADKAVSKSGKAFLYLPKKMQTDKRFKIALKKAPSIMGLIPKEEHTNRLKLKASLVTPKATKYFKN